ncbi:MAG TPA: serine/threonine-protein kinase, partial [Nannocystis sp.]
MPGHDDPGARGPAVRRQPGPSSPLSLRSGGHQADAQRPQHRGGHLRGDSLRTILRHHAIDPLPWREGAVLVADLLRALVELHGAGVLHRDLKPGNAIVTRGPDRMTLVLIDLGLAADLKDPSLHPNRRFGSPPYLAPERWRGEAADARSDVYSVGAIFYEMLTGTTPFLASERVELREQHLHSPVVPPRERAPRAQIPEEIQSLVLRALAKRRDDRFADATAFLGELEETTERLIYRMPRGYQLVPRDLRGWDASANDSTTEAPAAVRAPRAAKTDAGRSQRRAALLVGSVVGAVLATGVLYLRPLASSVTSELHPGAGSSAPEVQPVPGLPPPGASTSSLAGAQPEACDASERSDEPRRPDEPQRVTVARERDTKRRNSMPGAGPALDLSLSEQARRVATEQRVLVGLRA